MAVFMLFGKWPDNIDVLMICVCVSRMSSRHSSRRDVGMGSKAREVGLEFFYHSMQLCDCSWIKGVKNCK